MPDEQSWRPRADGDPIPETVVERRTGWAFVNVGELLEYRDLLRFLILRDLQVRYRQTVLGFTWAIIQPLFTMIIFAVVFGRLARMPSDGVPYPIFAYAALVPWTYFSRSMNVSTRSLVSYSNLLTRVYFPRLFLPVAPVLASLADFLIAMSMLALLMVLYGIPPTIGILMVPLLVVLMILTATGIGLWLSSLALQYRDLTYAMGFVTQLAMYAAPVVWPASLIPDEFRWLYGIYPMAGVIEGFRAALLGTTAMPWDLIAIGAASATTLAVSGAFVFVRRERLLADVA